MMRILKVFLVVIVLLLQASLVLANSYPYSVITVGNSSKSAESVVTMVCQIVELNGGYSYDPDGKIVAHQWIENKKIIANSTKISISIKDATTRLITLRVTDNEGGVGERAITIYSHSNAIPVIKSLENSNKEKYLYPMESFKITAKVDTDDKLKKIWEYDVKSFQKLSEGDYLAVFQVNRNISGSDWGGKTIKLKVVDTCGQEGEREISVNIALSKELKIKKIIIPDKVI